VTVTNPIAEFLRNQRIMIIDGGLATTLEARGHSLDSDLWSAKLLLAAPDEILRVHLEFLHAGADCIIASTYQASIPGLRKHGLNEHQSRELLRQSVSLARSARKRFWEDPSTHAGRQRPLVAASIGPYAAYLADGSEYSGRHSIDDNRLRAFHKTRLQVLSDSGADLLACETISSRRETAVLLELLSDTPGALAWMTFTCGDGAHLWDGTSICDAIADCDEVAEVIAVGINCTAPEFVPSLLEQIRPITSKPLIVYANSGEDYDAELRTWKPVRKTVNLADAAEEWARGGAVGIGGCCRVGPRQIAEIRKRLLSPPN